MCERAIAILQADFENSWAQARHYETVQITITTFLFTVFSALVAGGFVLLEKFGLSPRLELIIFSVSSLMCLIGLIFFAFSARNRFYFVRVVRYINEHRAFALRCESIDFKNESKFFADPRRPGFSNPFSTFVILSYFIALINALCFPVAIYFGISLIGYIVSFSFLAPTAGLFFIIELLFFFLYLTNCETKLKLQ